MFISKEAGVKKHLFILFKIFEGRNHTFSLLRNSHKLRFDFCSSDCEMLLQRNLDNTSFPHWCSGQMSSGLVFLLFSTALVVGHCAPAFAPSMPARQATVLPKSMLHPIFQTQLQKQAPGLTLELQASFKGYHDRIVKDKTGRLEKLSRHIFNLQDTLMQIAIAKELQEIAIAGPDEPSPNHTAVVGTGPAGLATAIMLARYVFGLFFPIIKEHNMI